MSLTKIPVILFITIAYKTITTPPNPTPPKDEIIPTTMTDWIANRKIVIQTAQIGQMLLAVAEIAALVANRLPSSYVTDALLSFSIYQGGDPHRLQFHFVNSLGAVCFIFGATLRYRAFQDLGRFFRFQISIQKDHQLITTGPYAYVRHPSYTGIVIADLGWLLWSVPKGSWVKESGFWDVPHGRVLFLVVYLCMLSGPALTLSRITNEESALKNKFGKEWEEWTEKVPYRLFPGIY